ncbi:hypothetical protein CPB84DRAFT_1813808 [Gymnopilus junonius]|uniref:Uncharacterized protein n=1 Tax=Gymnopilus junonius TaxID=109634 RepID=A0A9P5NRK9_GYMJU|nr:hypothetical protein CPB84DRAFT_1813808 [Gymnopilus junonius]
MPSSPLPDHSAPSRDPHLLPDFDSKAVPSAPTLYLPPLLSSLPKHISHQHPPVSNVPPLVTETRLPDIDPASLSLHKALHHFRPLTPKYASVSYLEAFNWSELVLPEEEEREWYCVVFRSKKKSDRDDISLYDADRLAHEEAVTNGGLILYWYGIPNQDTGMNLATCIWQSRKHAVAANSGPYHIKAMRLAAQAYEIYTLERYRLRKLKGDSGVSIEHFEGGEVGW